MIPVVYRASPIALHHSRHVLPLVYKLANHNLLGFPLSTRTGITSQEKGNEMFVRPDSILLVFVYPSSYVG